MKRLICFILALLFVASCLVGCSSQGDDGKTEIVCTVFPIYDWIKNIIGEENDDVTLTLLVKNGTDPHSYTPSPSDIAKISSCDILVYVGGESDAWVGDVLEGKKNDKMRAVKLLEILGDRAFIKSDDDHQHEHDHAENPYEEHVWLSLKNASFLCDEICKALCEELEDRSEKYQSNANTYINEIKSLDESYASVVASAKRDVLLFADRFPFGYLVEDYGIEYFAAFSGCSADSEASFETITSLAKKIDELSLEYVIVLENSGSELADTVISSSASKSAKILVIDSMQSVSSAELDDISYLSVMENNLSVIKTALS